MRRIINAALVVASAALLIGYGAAFIARWGVRGLIFAAIFGVVLSLAAVAGMGRLPGRGPRLAAALGYALLAGFAILSLLDAFKNDLIRDLLIIQAGTGLIGLIACALPRQEW